MWRAHTMVHQITYSVANARSHRLFVRITKYRAPVYLLSVYAREPLMLNQAAVAVSVTYSCSLSCTR